VAAACSDDNACTTTDFCDKGTCVVGGWLNCDDGSPCTTDGCSPSTGCIHAADVTECIDGDACTVGDHCQGAACLPGTVTACDDGNACTDDKCDPGQGCVFTANSLACADDQDGCTQDVCAAGSCSHLVLIGQPCDDGSACTKNDSCQVGGCAGLPAVWKKVWGPDAAIGWATAIASAEGGGWLIAGTKQKITGTTQKSIGGLMRFDELGNTLWTKSYPEVVNYPAERQGGWAVAFQGNVSFLDPAGKLVSSVPLPSPGLSGYVNSLVGDGDSVVSDAFWGYKGGPSIGAHRFFPNKPTATSVPIDEKVPYVRLARAQAGLVGCTEGGIGIGFHLYYLNGNLEVTKKLLLPLPGVTDSGYNFCHVGMDSGGNTLLFGQIDYYTGNSKAFVASVTPKGDLAWFLPLTAAGLGTGPVGGPWGSVLTNGDVELTAVVEVDPKQPVPKKHTVRWRVSSQGTLRWRLVTDGVQSTGPIVAHAPGAASASVYQDQVTGLFSGQLTVEDAFGNITCETSGACFDKDVTYCDDGDPCTNDLCKAATMCTHEQFPNGMPCAMGKTCSKGVCQ
jgi:hypothetical protein